MQSKGAIRFVAILIALACVYQLSFTCSASYQEKKAKSYAEKAVEKAKLSTAYSGVQEFNKVAYLDSVRGEKNRFFLDSISSEKVYLGFTYKDVKDKEINLGLDLKGGMNVMLEVRLSDLIKSLSEDNQEPKFLKALEVAQANMANSQSDFITLFSEAWTKTAGGERLSKIFGTYEMRDKIKPETSDADVIKIIREEAASAISNSFNVLRNRIDRFGVAQPNIQQIGNSGRILVELPGVKEPERVRKLLQGTASLEFWETVENKEVYKYLEEANMMVKALTESLPDSTNAAVAVPDSLKAESELLGTNSAIDTLSPDNIAAIKNNPLFALLSPNAYQGQLASGPCVGRAHYKDTTQINKWLNAPQVKSLFPSDIKLLWGVKAIDPAETVFELIAIKANTRDGKAPLDGGVVTDARTEFRSTNGKPEVHMTMNADGARIWATLTANNIGKCVAIVLDEMVYSYPVVNVEITGGSSQISGNFTVEEANDLTNVLKSGKLPAPAIIIQDTVVGPSLGSESIRAGMISFVIAFIMVLLYMLFYYNGAGVVANIALLTNVLFLFGALVSFGAVLTLPGIAGIVLTLGMAVDANVIIYERIKEELRAGKGLSLAVSEGYKNAYSAIIDGNLTTIITGIVLVVFGTGPVRGFATTLIIGIITSLLTSIFVTRLIFDRKLSRKKNITFSNRFTENFLSNIKINFVKIRKYAYVLSIALAIVCVISIFTKGFSYGVDFKGGRTYVVRFDKDVNTSDVRAAVLGEFKEGVEVKQFGGKNQVKITTKFMIEDNSESADKMVEKMLYNAVRGQFSDANITLEQFSSTLDNPNGIISSEKVGPTVADDIKRDAVIAIVVAMFAIFLYIALRFRNWSWGTGGLLSIMHDAIIVIGFFSIFSGILPFSLDIDQTFIAAILTIIGYSINDSVVIFDRIREYKMLYPKRDLASNINEALNSTLTRTINTGGTTLVVLFAIAIFGGEVIRGFSVALIIGVITGTYSSVFVGTPIVYDIDRKAVAKDKALKEKNSK